jgi:Zn-dependent peptidase ImmA (M78 family)/transcriptional regulator with XRE-family HTH domain
MILKLTGRISPTVTAAARGLRGSKLREARLAMRITQTELAARIGKTRQAVSQYEQEETAPDGDVMARIVEALDQPLAYFVSDAPPEFGASSVRFFRAFGPKTKRRNAAAEVLGSWLARTAKYLDTFINYPALDLPPIAQQTQLGGYSLEQIELAAEECRRHWKLGVGPISNMVSLLENKGIIVCRYVVPDEQIEAFSFWNGGKAMVFLASEKDSACRARFDAAHELGHLILHRGIGAEEIEDPSVLKAIEHEADLFAGAFLLPKASFAAEVFSTRLDAFWPLKLRWRVSAQAMIRRSRELDIIDPDQYLNLYKTISFRKMRKRELYDDRIQLEEPLLLRKAAQLLLNSGHKTADEMALSIQLTTQVIEQLCNLPFGSLAVPAEIKEFRPTLK